MPCSPFMCTFAGWLFTLAPLNQLINKPTARLQRVRDRVTHKVVVKVSAELRHRLGATIIGVLGHVGGEVRVEAFDIVERRAHIISDQKIIEQLIFNARHQRITRALETNPDIALCTIEVDCHARSSRGNLDEPKVLAKRLAGCKVTSDSSLVLGSQLIRPAVAKFLWFFYDAGRPTRIDRCNFICFAVYSNKSRKDLRPFFHGAAVVVLKFWNEIVGPRAVFTLVTVKR